MQIKRIILTSGGTKVLPFANRRVAALEKLRKEIGAFFLKKTYLINSYVVLIFVSEDSKRITIWGGEPHIVFASSEGLLNVYDYIYDDLSASGDAAVGVISLQQYFDRVNHINNAVGAKDGVPTGEIVAYGNQLTRSYEYELEFLRQGNVINARGAETSGAVATIELTGAEWSEIESVMQGGFLTLPIEITGENYWNFYSGPIILGLPIVSRNLLELFKWIPSIFYILPNDRDYLPGWYYGQRFGWLGASNMTDVVVDFLSLMDDKHEEAEKPFGYCERLTSVDGVAEGTVNFFVLSSPPDEPTEWNTYKSNTGFVYGGTVLNGYERTFAANPYPGQEASAAMWNFRPYVDPLKQDDPSEAAGAIIFTDTAATIYRWKGFLQELFSVSRYHSHSINTLGTKIAVFEGEDGVIDTVSVIDLFLEPVGDDQVITTVLREAGDVTGSLAILGEWIPVPKPAKDVNGEDLVSSVLPYNLDDGLVKSYSVNTDGMGSLASMSYPESGNGVVNFHNIIVNGTNAVISNTLDECFESVIIVDPDYVGERINHKEIRGFVAGNYSGTKDEVVFEALGEGIEIKRETPSITADPTTGKVFITGFMGDIVSTQNVSPSGYVVWDSNPCGVTISATSSCGQTASADVSQNDELVASIAYAGIVPSAIGATGGLPPYSYAISCGVINSSTGEITDTSGCCGMGTGTVTDSCGDVSTVDIRFNLNSGWCVVEHKSAILTDCFQLSAVNCTEISGDTKFTGNDIAAFPTAPGGCSEMLRPTCNGVEINSTNYTISKWRCLPC